MHKQTPITKNQAYALDKLLNSITIDTAAKLFILEKLLNVYVKGISQLTMLQWIVIRNRAYPNWTESDWTVSKEFKQELTTLYQQYQETVLGQLRLFE